MNAATIPITPTTAGFILWALLAAAYFVCRAVLKGDLKRRAQKEPKKPDGPYLRGFATVAACHLVANVIWIATIPITAVTLGRQLPTEVSEVLEQLIPDRLLVGTCLVAIAALAAVMASWQSHIKVDLRPFVRSRDPDR